MQLIGTLSLQLCTIVHNITLLLIAFAVIISVGHEACSFRDRYKCKCDSVARASLRWVNDWFTAIETTVCICGLRNYIHTGLVLWWLWDRQHSFIGFCCKHTIPTVMPHCVWLKCYLIHNIWLLVIVGRLYRLPILTNKWANDCDANYFNKTGK